MKTVSARTRTLQDDQGATALEWTLLIAAIAIPSYFLFALALNLLVTHYRILSLLNSLPLP
ncbi:MAG: hypothetical protein R3336_05940 [Phycisphaeraceae bacterium]|nr:hypothetical protein [Phycisphaeraceae bacterium]